jgi:hypothetical protein
MAFKRSSVRFRLAPPNPDISVLERRRLEGGATHSHSARIAGPSPASSEPDRIKIGRTNALKLFRLPH